METKNKQREVLQELTFNVPGTFKSKWAADGWLQQNGYSSGSTTHSDKIVAIRKGEYDLPQKWHNFTKEDKESVDGVMISTDYREGEVKIFLYK